MSYKTGHWKAVESGPNEGMGLRVTGVGVLGRKALQRPRGLPDTSPVLLPPERAQGTHQMTI